MKIQQMTDKALEVEKKALEKEMNGHDTKSDQVRKKIDEIDEEMDRRYPDPEPKRVESSGGCTQLDVDFD